MPTIPGHPWLTDHLRKKSLAWIEENPLKGCTTLQRDLGVTKHQAQTIIDLFRHGDAEPERFDALRRKVSYLEAENNQLRDRLSVGQMLKEAFAQAIPLLPALKLPKPKEPPASKLDAESVILHLSDMQVGQVVSAKHTGGLGEYNFEIFKQRMMRYRENVRRILRYTPNPIDECVVALGGDLVDGSTVFRGQQRQIDLVTVRQVTEVYHHIGDLLLDLLSLFRKVRVVSVSGNHGRIGLRGENAPHDNLDWLCAYFLQERFARSGAGERITFAIPETWWLIFEVKGFKFLLVHGEMVKAWLGIPFYGSDRFKARMREMFHELTGSKVNFDFVLIAHHHDPAYFHSIYMNGAWPGGSEFSLKDLQIGGLPQQQMLGVHGHRGVSWHRWIHLADRHEMPQPEVFK